MQFSGRQVTDMVGVTFLKNNPRLAYTARRVSVRENVAASPLTPYSSFCEFGRGVLSTTTRPRRGANKCPACGGCSCRCRPHPAVVPAGWPPLLKTAGQGSLKWGVWSEDQIDLIFSTIRFICHTASFCLSTIITKSLFRLSHSLRCAACCAHRATFRATLSASPS